MVIDLWFYWIEMSVTELIFLLALITAAVFLTVFYFKIIRKQQLERSLNMAMLQIAVSKKTEPEEGNRADFIKENIAIMEQLFANLSNIREKPLDRILHGPFHLSFEIATPIDSNQIFFYVGAPRKFISIVEKQINSFYHDALIERITDYNIFVPGGGSAASYMTLKRENIFPIKTYQHLEADPILSITNALSKIPLGKGAALQIIAKPAGTAWQDKNHKIVKEMQKGESFTGGRSRNNQILFKVVKEIGEMLTGRIMSTSEKQQEEEPVHLTQVQEEIIKAVESKASKVGYETNVRLIASAENDQEAEHLLRELENSFTQYNDPETNGFKITEALWDKKGFLNQTVYNFIFRIFNTRRKTLLNTEEMASLFHFPIANTNTPQIKWLKSKQAPPPAELPEEGLLLGYNAYRGDKHDIRLTREDRRRHMYIIGQTGTGKSSLMSNLVKEDIKKGEGLCVIDPHGDLIEDALEAVPKERAEDVILFDPSNTERPIGLNLLEYDPQYPEQKTFVINEMIKIFDKLYDLSQTGGPMFEQYMRNAMLLIMDDPESGSTLIEISKVLSDADFRKYKLSKCQNFIVRDFWQKEAEKAGGEAALANMVPYITSKLTPFISNDTMRPIIGQQTSSINFREIMDTRKILLVNLSKGRIGETNAHLLGLVLVGKILIASLSRTDMRQEDRQDFYLYIDEFQNFTTDSISTILSEARKYRLCLTIAHQFLGQLPEEIQKSVFGNVGTLCSFRIGPEDAEFIAKQFAPVFGEQDLINIDNYNALLRLMIEGKTSDGFNLKTYPPVEGNRALADNIKQLSMLKFGKNRQIVEHEILQRTRLVG